MFCVLVLLVSLEENNPFFITAFGKKGPEEYQKRLLKEAAETVKKYPEVIGVSYFNKEDVPEAGVDIEVPKWSISEEKLHVFVRTLTDPEYSSKPVHALPQEYLIEPGTFLKVLRPSCLLQPPLN